MKSAYFRFFGELNDMLPADKRQTRFTQSYNDHPTVKHMIESFGVPHVEVYAIQANGVTVNFDYLLKDEDRIHVFPHSFAVRSKGIRPLQEPYEGESRFILDNHLGRLAAYLRLLGFDTWYRNDFQDNELADLAFRTQRILLTRDLHLLMRKQIRYGYWVRSLDPGRQIKEIVRRFNLIGQTSPFKRCLRCNGALKPVSKADIIDRLEPLTRRYFQEFHICSQCGQIYWKGSHYQRMTGFIANVLNS